MMSMDDELLMAFLDDELDEITRSRVAAALDGDPTLRERLEAQRALRNRLRAHYDPVAEEAVPARLRAMIQTDVVDLAAARAQRWRPAWQAMATIAATLIIGIFVGRSLPDGASVATEGGALVARGTLADVLDRQLASSQSSDASTRIGLTFASTDGRLCRTFDSPALSGLACRDQTQWRMVLTTEGSPPGRGDYRQAGSGPIVVLEAAQARMAGDPLDAVAERRARDGGWRSAR